MSRLLISDFFPTEKFQFLFSMANAGITRIICAPYFLLSRHVFLQHEITFFVLFFCRHTPGKDTEKRRLKTATTKSTDHYAVRNRLRRLQIPTTYPLPNRKSKNGSWTERNAIGSMEIRCLPSHTHYGIGSIQLSRNAKILG